MFDLVFFDWFGDRVIELTDMKGVFVFDLCAERTTGNDREYCVRIGRNIDHLFDLFAGFVAVHDRHVEIHEDYVKKAFIGIFLISKNTPNSFDYLESVVTERDICDVEYLNQFFQYQNVKPGIICYENLCFLSLRI